MNSHVSSSNDLPGMSHLARLQGYTDNPTPVGGIDFIGPLALKALERLKEGAASNCPIRRDNDLDLDDHMNEAWVSTLQKAAENLPLEVIEKLSITLNAFLRSKEEEKSGLALIVVKILQENSVDPLHLFDECLNNQEMTFLKLKSKLKECVDLSIKIDLCKALLNWIRKKEEERVSMIYNHCILPPFSAVPKGLKKAEEEEIYAVEMQYFDRIKEVDQNIYSNQFLLDCYKKMNAFSWEEEIQTLMESNERCGADKISLEKERSIELSQVSRKYEILFNEEKQQQAQREEALKVQREIERQRAREEQAERQNRRAKTVEELRPQALHAFDTLDDDINRLMLALEQKESGGNKKCAIM